MEKYTNRLEDKIMRFPDDFLWCGAVAAYQIEGGWDADRTKRRRITETGNW